MNIALNLVIVTASVLGSGMAFPQARRLVKTRSVDGVSPTWIGVSLAINAWWTAYALAESVWALLPVSFVSFVLYAVMGVFFLTSVGRTSIPGILAGGLGLGMVPLPVLLLAGWKTAGVAIGLCYGLQLAPAVFATFRTRELSGVSAGTWTISLIEAVLWAVYGVAVADNALIAGGATGVLMSSVILMRLVWTGHRPFAWTLRAVRRKTPSGRLASVSA